METAASSGFWWLKSSKLGGSSSTNVEADKSVLTSTSKLGDNPSMSSSLQEFIEKERALQSPGDADNTDIGSIIEEINRLAAQSPLGPYENDVSGRSVEDLMREAEKIYMESSKSFEQLSARSRTSANVTGSLDDSPKSTPTPKSASPLPLDSNKPEDDDEHIEGENLPSDNGDDLSSSEVETQDESIDEEEENENREIGESSPSYSDDFTRAKGSGESASPRPDDEPEISRERDSVVPDLLVTNMSFAEHETLRDDLPGSRKTSSSVEDFVTFTDAPRSAKNSLQEVRVSEDDAAAVPSDNPLQTELINKLEEENANLLANVNVLQAQLEETKNILNAELQRVPLITEKLEQALEELKDTKESNTALQLQLNNLNKTHQHLKLSYDEVTSSSGNLNKRVQDVELLLEKYRNELQGVQEQRDKVFVSEENIRKVLEVEKLQVKKLKTQNEKDARCILDLTRQVKEMERIIARKHPDSVSALIVAAKRDQTENNLSARKLLEDRIKNLEEEVSVRDKKSSQVFLEVQEKFTEMKTKYESHIEDLELHVNDLKEQLKRKDDAFDVYTQTHFEEQVPAKETKDICVQTQNGLKLTSAQKNVASKKVDKIECKDDAHLLATIRGLQNDLTNKEKGVAKLHKELEEAKKTNRRLQKEREGNLKSITEKREVRNFSEKILSSSGGGDFVNYNESDDLSSLRTMRDKLRLQLCKIEEDYQNLKSKRLYDLSALQQAHEEEISTYMATVKNLHEQLEIKKITITTLQEQLQLTKDHVEVLIAEKDELSNRLSNYERELQELNSNNQLLYEQKVLELEARYQDRENRIRTIVHGLSQKNSGNINCSQCAARHQQLILYKNELDQLLATVRTLAWQ